MTKIQDRGSANEAKGSRQGAGKATGAKSKQNYGKAEKHGAKDGAVLADVNGEARKTTKSTRKETK